LIIPDGRTLEYIVWRVCERFKIRPPGVKDCWDDIDFWTQAMLIAFEQGRQKEEDERIGIGLV
jgi:hypothetical protein